jgi:hypothetical protein
MTSVSRLLGRTFALTNAFFFAVTGLLLSGCGRSSQSSASVDAADESERTALSRQTSIDNAKLAQQIPFRAPREFIPRASLSTTNTASPEYIREWNWFSTVADYQRIGRTNAAWDADALDALERYCDVRLVVQDSAALAAMQKRSGDAAAKAIAAKCDDPLIEYIHIRYILSQRNTTPLQIGELYATCAEHFEQTDYASIRKLYPELRAAEYMTRALGRSTNASPRLTAMERAMIQHFNDALHDPKMPPSEAAELAIQVWDAAKPTAIGRRDFEKILLPILDARWRDHSFSHLVAGRFYIEKAWRLRGNGYANTVSEAGWQGFNDSLEKARASLERAWALDKTNADIPTQMITVCMGLSLHRDTMEDWFDRAMSIDPNCYDAVSAKEYFLEPKWGGSDEELIAFGRKCVATKKWGGEVPLILQKIHHSLQKYYNASEEEYFSTPEVWRDLSRSYERFFELNPTQIGWRHNYAYDAFRAGKYEVFLDQLPQFTSGTNYQFFGGKSKFDSMVRTATEKTK